MRAMTSRTSYGRRMSRWITPYSSFGSYSGSSGSVRAGGVDEIDARQVVLQRDFLRAQMLLNGHRQVRAAVHGRVVRDDEALALPDPPDAGDDARGGRFFIVDPVRGERRELEERRVGIEQRGDALAHEH